jgi:hypothetical protein
MYAVRSVLDAVLNPNGLPFWFAVVVGSGGVFMMAVSVLT